MNDKKKAGKLATYSVIMILMVIIVIIFAAMADNREEVFRTQIDETSQTNVEIRNELVILKDENNNLKQQLEGLQAGAEENAKKDEICSKLTEVWNLFESGDINGAKTKYSEIDGSTIPESLSAFYAAVGDKLN